jgi:hypothetical protein
MQCRQGVIQQTLKNRKAGLSRPAFLFAAAIALAEPA